MTPEETVQHLLGTWKLVSAERHNLDTGVKDFLMGPAANGFINYGADNRVIVLVVGGPRTKPASQMPSAAEKQALYDSLNSYAGTYSVAGDIVTHHVDTSWNEMWTGHDQKRQVKFIGDRLQLSGLPARADDGHTYARVMTWERAS